MFLFRDAAKMEQLFLKRNKREEQRSLLTAQSLADGGRVVMSTYMLTKERVERKWHVVDAANMSLGRLAGEIARLLMGKHRPNYTPHVDCGDHVIVLNAGKIVLTGRKLQQKFYRYHTGWVGGLKEISYKILMEKKPEKAVMLAIKGMLPKNSIGRKSLTRVRVYSGCEHKHAAQQPVLFGN